MISTQILERYPYFSGLSEDLLGRIAMISQMIPLNPGQNFFREGERAAHLSVLAKGVLDVSMTLGNGERVVVDSLVAGDLVGLSSFASRKVWRADADAKTACEMVSIDADRLFELCEANPALGYSLLKGMVDALHHRLDDARIQLAAAIPK